jgi:hypothetical protein
MHVGGRRYANGLCAPLGRSDRASNGRHISGRLQQRIGVQRRRLRAENATLVCWQWSNAKYRRGEPGRRGGRRVSTAAADQGMFH